MNINWQYHLRLLSVVMLGVGILGALATSAIGLGVVGFSWALIGGGGLLALGLFFDRHRVYAWVANEIARAAHRAAPHINAGLREATDAIRQNPWLYLMIFLGAATLIFMGLAIIKESIYWFRWAIFSTLLTVLSAVTHYDGWGNAGRNWDKIWLGLSLLGIPLVLLYGWNLGWIGVLSISVLLAFTTVMDGWGKVADEAWKVFSGHYGKYEAAGALTATLFAIGGALYFFDQSGLIRLKKVIFLGGYFPEIAGFFLVAASFVAGVTVICAMFVEGRKFANN